MLSGVETKTESGRGSTRGPHKSSSPLDVPRMGGTPVKEAKTNSIIIPGVRCLPATKIEVGSRLGVGAFGVVHQATYHYRPGYSLPIARKEVVGTHVDLSKAQQYEAFEWEVMRLAGLQHPNLVRLYGYHQEETQLFLDMEYCAGDTLDKLLKKGRLPLSRCWQIALDLARGLLYLEHHGVVHRDLKPDNILLDSQGRAKLADLGIAQVDALVQVSEAKTVTQKKAQSWAAPEETLGEPASTASDRYSLGLVLWYLVTGKNPLALPGFVIHGALTKELFQTRLLVLDAAMKAERPSSSEARVLYDLICTGLLACDPHSRISANVLVTRLGCLASLHPQGLRLLTAQITGLLLEEQRDTLMDYVPLQVTSHPLEEDSDTYWQRWEQSDSAEKADEKAKIPSSTGSETKGEAKRKAPADEIQDVVEAPQKLEDNFRRFLADPDVSVLTLFGEGGLGKSLSTYQLAQRLLQEPWESSEDDGNVEVKSWVTEGYSSTPAFYGHVAKSDSSVALQDPPTTKSSVGSPAVELSSARPPAETSTAIGWLPVFIRPGISSWAHSQLDNGLVICLKTQYHLDDKAIAALKRERLLFIFDGYDELQSDIAPQNLPTQLGLGAFPRAKLIVTSRRSAIVVGEETAVFSAGGRMTAYYLLPLPLSHMLTALEQRLQWRPEERENYAKRLQETSTLRIALRNPFVLNLFIQSWETLSRQDFSTLTRVRIYEGFIRHWLTTQQDFIAEPVQRTLQGESPDLITSFCQLAGSLAFDAYQQKTHLVEEKPYVDEKSYPWLHLLSLVESASRAEFAKRKRALADNPEASARALLSEEDYVSLMHIKGEYFTILSPLKQRASGQWNFLHKSFYEYFVASFLLKLCDNQGLENLYHALNSRNIQEERGIIDFMAELLAYDSAHSETRKSTLFNGVVKASRDNPAIAQAAANAITVLNAAWVSFSGQGLRGIRIRGADLSGALLDNADCREVDFREVNLQGAWLRQAKLTAALLDNVHFGQWANLKLPEYSSATACVYSRNGRWLAVGGSDQKIYLYDTKTYTLQHTLSGRARGMVFSPDETRLASGVYQEKTIRVWDAASGRLIYALRGHKEEGITIAFSPDGRCLASGVFGRIGIYKDKTVRLWDMTNGRAIQTLTGHTKGVNEVVFSPNGRSLASGSSDETVRLWDTTSGRILHVLIGHKNSVNSVVYSPDGMFLASGSDGMFLASGKGRGSTVCLWIVASGHLAHTFSGHEWDITSITFSPDGACLASASRDNTVRLWDTNSGSLIHILHGHTSTVNEVVFSPNGEYLASGGEYSDNTVRLWDRVSGRVIQIFNGHTDSVHSVAFSPDGRRLVSASRDGVRFWDMTSQHTKQTLSGHTHQVYQVVFSLNGKCLASASRDGTLCLWNTASGRLRYAIINKGKEVVFSPDGSCMAVAHENELCLRNTSNGQAMHLLTGHADAIYKVAFSPDGAYLASGSGDGTIRLWKVKNGRLKRTLDNNIGVVRDVSYTMDGSRLVTRGMVFDVAFSPDGTHLASASEDKNVYLWETASGGLTRTLRGHHQSVRCVAFSPDGAWLASGGGDPCMGGEDKYSEKDNAVRLWNTASGQLAHTLTHDYTENHDYVRRMFFSPDGKYLASFASDDRTVNVWNTANGCAAWELGNHTITGKVIDATFSPEGTHLATVSDNKTVRIWNTSNGRCLNVLEFHTNINSLSWRATAKGSFLAMGSNDCAVRCWEILKPSSKHSSDDGTKKLRVQLRWSSHRGMLNAAEADLTNAIGLSDSHRALLSQYGAKVARAVTPAILKENKEEKRTTGSTKSSFSLRTDAKKGGAGFQNSTPSLAHLATQHHSIFAPPPPLGAPPSVETSDVALEIEEKSSAGGETKKSGCCKGQRCVIL